MRTLILSATLCFAASACAETLPRFAVSGGTLTLEPVPAGFLVPMQAPQLTPRPAGAPVFYARCQKSHEENTYCGYTTAPHVIAFQTPDRVWVFQAVNSSDEINAEWRVQNGEATVTAISSTNVSVKSSQRFKFIEIQE